MQETISDYYSIMNHPLCRIEKSNSRSFGRKAIPMLHCRWRAAAYLRASPADDFLEGSIDLNRLLIRDPSATFFARVDGSSMQGDGIFDGNLLVVEKKIRPDDGDIVVCYLNGEFTLKRLEHRDGKIFLMPSNPKFHPIEVSADDELIVWGSVRASINEF